MDIELRSLSLYEEFKSAERVQAVAFGFEPLDIVPYMLMQSFATSGGIVVGAFDAEQMTFSEESLKLLLEDFHVIQQKAQHQVAT